MRLAGKDLKSQAPTGACGFDSHPRHQSLQQLAAVGRTYKFLNFGTQDYSLPIFALFSLNTFKAMQINAGFVYNILEFVG
jgi:hypothetical protein